MQDLRLLHSLDDCVELRYGDGVLFRYVYVPRTQAVESPRPYFHPLKTLAGNEVTIFRPHDHPWHAGLSMTSANLSGQNFWGGPSYVAGKGYVSLPNNGRVEHTGWEKLVYKAGKCVLHERLRWVTEAGEVWIEEKRGIAVQDVDESRSSWSLVLSFLLQNVSGQPLVFGSPTTEGRPMAGYGGLFWRGPRSFQGGSILAAEGLQGPEVMGQRSPWLAYIGKHDGTGDTSTLVFADQPSNPRFPNKWFVRNDPYACISCSFMFDEEYILEGGDTLDLRYAVLFADGALSSSDIQAQSEALQPACFDMASW